MNMANIMKNRSESAGNDEKTEEPGQTAVPDREERIRDIQEKADADRFEEALDLCREEILKDRGNHTLYHLFYTIAVRNILRHEIYSEELDIRIGEACDIGFLLLEKAPPELYPKYKIKVDSSNDRITRHGAELKKTHQKEEIRKAKRSAVYFLAAALVILFLMGCVLVFISSRTMS